MCKFSVFATGCVCTFAISSFAQVDEVPARSEDNLIVGVYNIQFVGQRTHDLNKLAGVISRFDVCGVLEVKRESVLRELVSELESATGTDWNYVYGVRTHRPGGTYHEAYGAVWRTDRVQLGGGVVGGVWDLEEAFRNDPYLVSFKRNNFDFTLMLIHTRWSNDDEGTRAGEVAMAAEQVNWMRGFLEEGDWIVAGDFNYPGTNDNMEQMASDGALVQLDDDPKSTFKSNNSGYASSYDHMYVVAGRTPEYVDGSCSTLDATKLIYGSNSRTNMGKSKSELSDHLPIFAVFRVNMADDD